MRKRLLKFTMIGEKHRDAVFGRRRAFLTGESEVDIWQNEFADDYSTAVQKFGEDKVNALQKRVILQVINEYWSDYLDYTSYLRDGIHLTRIGGKNPADEYNITCEEFFSGMEEQVIDTMGERLQTLLSLDNIDDFVINTPTELWTYTLNESGEELLKRALSKRRFPKRRKKAITITAMTATAGTKTKRKNRQTKSRQKKAFSQNYSVRRIKI